MPTINRRKKVKGIKVLDFKFVHRLCGVIIFCCILFSSTITKICAKNLSHLFTVLAVSKEEKVIYAVRQTNNNSKRSNSANYEFTAKLENQTVHLGEKIVLRITVKNNSSEYLYMISSDVYYDTKVEVKDSNGKPISLSEKGRKNVELGGLLGRMRIEIMPDEETFYEMYIHDLYDLKMGSYTIIATRSFSTKDESVLKLKTNKVKLNVIK